MRRRTAAILAGLAAVALAAALLLERDDARTSLPPATALFPELAAQMATVRRVEVVRGKNTVVLARDGDAWRLPDHAGFPADTGMVATMLSGLAALRLLEPRTADPALLARLGLEDPATAGATGTLVRVGGADGVRAAIVLGRDVVGGPADARRRDVYLRRPDETQAWLAQPSVEAPADWLDWAGRGLVDVAPEDVAGIVSTRAGGPTLAFERRGEHLEATAPAADRPALDRYRVDDLGRALSGLSMRDVRAVADVPGGKVGEATVTTRQGLAITAGVWIAPGATWVALSARGTGEAEAGAAALQARFAGWAFQVERGREAALLPTLADLAAYAPAAPAPAVQKPRR